MCLLFRSVFTVPQEPCAYQAQVRVSDSVPPDSVGLAKQYSAIKAESEIGLKTDKEKAMSKRNPKSSKKVFSGLISALILSVSLSLDLSMEP